MRTLLRIQKQGFTLVRTDDPLSEELLLSDPPLSFELSLSAAGCCAGATDVTALFAGFAAVILLSVPHPPTVP